jgi:hypothetical protein
VNYSRTSSLKLLWKRYLCTLWKVSETAGGSIMAQGTKRILWHGCKWVNEGRTGMGADGLLFGRLCLEKLGVLTKEDDQAAVLRIFVS